MCTVSLAYSTDQNSLRLVINRDERRNRMSARPPAIFDCDGVPAAWPVDLQDGGTWAAINAHGLAFALLNASSAAAAPNSGLLITRGAIIPALAAATGVEDAVRRFAIGPINWTCRPFKLVIASLERIVVLSRREVAEVEVPLALATSSLGDALVAIPRRELFEELLRTSESAWHAQDRLHQHAWPDRRHLSVLMSRADACTVSRTEMVITRENSAMAYAAIHDGWPAGIAVPPIRIASRRAAVAA